MSTGKVVSGILVGIAAGAILGILFAPDKGQETRKKIRQTTDDLVNNLKSKLNMMADEMAENYEDVSEKSQNL